MSIYNYIWSSFWVLHQFSILILAKQTWLSSSVDDYLLIGNRITVYGGVERTTLIKSRLPIPSISSFDVLRKSITRPFFSRIRPAIYRTESISSDIRETGKRWIGAVQILLALLSPRIWGRISLKNLFTKKPIMDWGPFD